MTVIQKIILFLRSRGYDVSNKIQENAHNNQVIVLLEDILPEVESQNSYFIDITLSILYVSDDPDEIINTFMTLPFEIEQTLRDDTELSEVLTIEVGAPEIERNGRVYAMAIPLSYRQQKII